MSFSGSGGSQGKGQPLSCHTADTEEDIGRRLVHGGAGDGERPVVGGYIDRRVCDVRLRLAIADLDAQHPVFGRKTGRAEGDGLKRGLVSGQAGRACQRNRRDPAGGRGAGGGDPVRQGSDHHLIAGLRVQQLDLGTFDVGIIDIIDRHISIHDLDSSSAIGIALLEVASRGGAVVVGIQIEGRGVISRCDGYVERAGRRRVGGIADLWNSSIPIGCRREDVAAVGFEGDRADQDVRAVANFLRCGTDIMGNRHSVAGIAKGRNLQNAVDVAVIGKDIARGDAVLGNRNGICHQLRRIVDRVDRDDQDCRVGLVIRSGTGIGDVRNRAEVIIHWVETNRPIRRDGQGSDAGNRGGRARGV